MDKLEAVSEEEQRRQTLKARRGEQERRVAAWKAAHGQIDGVLDRFVKEARLVDPRTISEARAIRSAARRIDQRLGA